MRWFITGLLIVLVVIALGLFTIPASVVPFLLQKLESGQLLPAGAPQLTLLDTEGTLWRGGAHSAALTIDGVELDLGKMTWSLDKLPLLSGQARLQLAVNSDAVAANAGVSVDTEGNVSISQLEGRLPIATLEPWVPMLVTGNMAFFIDRLDLSRNTLVALQGLINFEYIDWVGADYNMPLGSYMAELSLLENRQVSLVFSDLDARLGITGTLNLEQNGRYHFNALLQPRDGLAPEVGQSIRWFGQVDASGNVLINNKGRF